MWWQYLILLGLLIVAGWFLILLYTLIFHIYIVAQGAFFAETSHQRIKQIISLVNLKPGMKIADLGSGDGRILIALCKAYPVTATGYEIDAALIKKSRKAVKEAGLEKQITIEKQSYWKVDLSKFDLITIYGIGHIMSRLEKKLQQEMKQTAHFISVYFPLPNWKPEKTLGEIKLYGKNR